MSTCSICKQPMAADDDCGGDCTRCMADAGDPDCIAIMYERLKRQQLTVWYGSMPESNGRQNWTAILHRKGESILDGHHFTIKRSEYPDRVRYEADRVRYLIGELDEEPDIIAYDANLHSGYVPPKEHPDG